MTDFPDYNKATNAAYELLINYQGIMPQIDVFSVIDLLPYNLKVSVHTYSQCAKKMRCSYKDFFKKYASSEHGFTIPNLKEKKYIICFNEKKDEPTIRFTMAHEIGHIYLDHKADNSITDKEANCFARNLLCPIQIAEGFHVNTEREYVECFGISEPMAAATVANRKSDKFYITNDNYNKFNDNVYCYFSGYTLAELYGYSSYC